MQVGNCGKRVNEVRAADCFSTVSISMKLSCRLVVVVVKTEAQSDSATTESCITALFFLFGRRKKKLRKFMHPIIISTVALNMFRRN
jgi:hypothetical protein